MSEAIRIGVAGALGRMGQTVIRIVGERDGVAVSAKFDREPGQGLVGRDEALGLCDVIIDFTSGEASAALARAAAARGGPALVIGSTGFTPEALAAVAEAAQRIAIVRSGNFSLGVNMMLGLVRRAARALDAGAYDVEVFEAHHRRKVDAPSGTALMLGQAAADGRGVDLDQASVRVRDGITGARDEGTIGFSVMRGGGVVGEHSVVFAAEDEILTFSHSARDRSLFARGAVEAAAWAARRGPGLYDMQDVLGLRD